MIGANLITHAEAYGVGVVALLISAAKNLPKPGSSCSGLTIYTWFYDTVQSALPIPRNSQSGNGSLNGVPIPTPAVYPPTTK
jgi:hypothetical protein